MTAPTQELLDNIFRRRVLQARATPPGRRIVDSLRFYRRSVGLMCDGIRMQFPDANDEEVERILSERLDQIRDSIPPID